jgi:RNA 3'-terminal phosphate cyclase (ATP)
MGLHPPDIRLLDMPSHGKGTMLLIFGEFERSTGCYFSLGARGKPAEQVANEAVEALEGFIASEAAIDEYLADQLLLPLALADGPSKLHTSRVTEHLTTNAAVIQHFLPVDISIHGQTGEPGEVEIRPA